MADQAPVSNVFTFVAVRPPQPPDAVDARLRTFADPRPADASPLEPVVAKWKGETMDQERIRRDVLGLVKEHGYAVDLRGGSQDSAFERLDAAITGAGGGAADADGLAAAIGSAFDLRADEVVGSDRFRELEGRLWDAYYCFLILQRFSAQDLDALTRALRLTHLVRELGDAEQVTTPWLEAVLTATPLVPERYSLVPRPTPPEQSPPPPEPDRSRELKALWAKVVATQTALDHVRALSPETRESRHTETIPATDPRTGKQSQSKQTTHVVGAVAGEPLFGTLRSGTQRVLTNLGTSGASFTIPDATEVLTGELARLTGIVEAETSEQLLDYMPPAARQIPGLKVVAEQNIVKGIKDGTHAFPVPKSIRRQIKPLGIGDLKVVKQRLTAYVPGEVAHIENVLRGEFRERRHRVLDRSEVTVTTAEETVEETTRDTQTTDRYELKKETSNEISEQMSVSAGVTVSGSYGPVTFGAHGDFAYSTSTNTSEKSASNYAREVVDKAVSRVEKKTRTERVAKTLHEVEELNTHGIDNKGQPDNVTGVYRWVDKHYEAQIYNYGKRLMLEFVVPEPSALYDYYLDGSKKVAIPRPKDLPAGLGPDSVTELTYRSLARDYAVDGLTPPPPEWRSVTAGLASDATIENGKTVAKTSKDLVVPEGYKLDNVGVSISFIYENNPQVKLSLGTDFTWYTLTDNDARRRADWTSGVGSDLTTGSVPLSVNMYDINGYFVNAIAWCRRTPELYAAWQMSMYRKIVAAHDEQVRAWEEKVNAASAQQTAVVIQGRNPRANEEIVRGELKRQCTEMLMDTWQYGSYDATKDTFYGPTMDIEDAANEGKQIQFFEQAFEWENLTYLFYPYFWGRRGAWQERMLVDDPDPQFAAFLRAGAARVVVPARTAYNDAVMHFLETDGVIWNGGETPRLDDPLFVSLADELRGQTDDLQNATPEGDPWEVVLPTTLVWLQGDSTLPTFP